MKIYSPDRGTDPFGIFDDYVQVKDSSDLKNDGVLLLWGGEDISPRLYGEKPNEYVYTDYPSSRDVLELSLIQRARSLNMPIIGICRGAQLLCAVAGGTLLQHIEAHGWNHPVTLLDEGLVEISCNSSHHQMMLPPKDAQVLAAQLVAVNGVDQFNKPIVYHQANEVVYFPSHDNYCVRKIKEYLL